ncbi:MAG: hypothetical protein HKL90_13870 [Elusimicrobia bacterium]|nr:hypothetical protein [Elusimicrobiota bacterium]
MKSVMCASWLVFWSVGAALATEPNVSTGTARSALPELPRPAAADAALANSRDRVQGVLASAASGFDGATASLPVVALGAKFPTAPAAAPQSALLPARAPRYDARVAAAQRALDAVRRAEGLPGIRADGFFGLDTQRAVLGFQIIHGLPATGDIDAATSAALLALSRARQEPSPEASHRPAATRPPAPAAAPPEPPLAAVSPPPSILRPSRDPRYDPLVATIQLELDAVRRAEGLSGIRPDGFFGPGTGRAVYGFQKIHGLPATGMIDAATQSELLRRYQEITGLPATGTANLATDRALAVARGRTAPDYPGRYFSGPDSDFTPDRRERTIHGVLATVYTPYLDLSAAQLRREGPPIDRFTHAICTLERFLAGRCPYVSVAIDRSLDVPDGTPLLIPGIDDIAGRHILFRIVDTGAVRLFHGTGHIDVATDSNEYGGLGSRITGREFTLILPEGLHPRRP